MNKTRDKLGSFSIRLETAPDLFDSPRKPAKAGECTRKRIKKIVTWRISKEIFRKWRKHLENFSKSEKNVQKPTEKQGNKSSRSSCESWANIS